uniref:Reverse transcriptase domain-containing protein n=1 Tax=Tanacetum cinerariifolium TaxID=118510 RepID=A0A6L2JYQ0_TANCI|nr:reverse transcriptase domain-containing protein [Tanacetum cinerariifolium]
MDKIRRDKRKEVYTRLDFGEDSKKSRRIRVHTQNLSAKTLSARYRNPSERPQIRDRLRNNDGNVFGRIGHRRKSAFKRLSDTYSPSTTKFGPDREYSRDDSYSRGRPHQQNSSPSRDRPRSRDRSQDIKESYGNTYSSYRTGDKHRYHSHGIGCSSSMKKGRNSESLVSRVSKSGTSEGGHWKSKSKGGKPTDEEDLAVPLSWTARVWFDELPPESIDGYKDLKAAFLAYFRQQKKYVKDAVEIHNIKQKDGETIEDFMERFKNKTGRMKGAPECLGIFGFMHGVNNPELTKRLNEHVPKTLEEMMTTTEVLYGEKPLNQPKDGRGSNKFTPLTKTPKEIFAAESGKFKPPPPMVTPLEKRSSNKFCEFHNDKGHSTDESTPKDHAKKAKAHQKNFKVAIHPGFPDQEITIGGTPPDMTEVPRSIAEHRLNIREGHSPVRLKKQGQASERAKAIQVEVQKLVEAGILREVYYHDWLSKPIMVKKHDGYHQIHMAGQDEEKIAFHTSHGVYCYTKMPFGLKNAGATYQRLVDKAFDKQVGRNLEIYVDDLVIKSHTETELLRDIEETFRTLRKINMKLNPKKWEQNITYRLWTSVKGQILADFLVEKPNDAPPDTSVIKTPQELWTLFTDGSSCVDGSSAWLILTSPEGTEFTYALRFLFTAYNNEAEYEALIVLVEVLKEKSIQEEEVTTVVEEEGPTWMTPIMKYLKDGTLPEGPGKVKFLIVTIDYFTKWIEAKSVATITGNQVKKFVWDNIVCRFGLPGEIVSDNDKQFNDNPFKDWCEKLNITQRFALVKHPQSNGLVERVNQSLGEGIKARLGEGNENWIKELPHVRWAHRTMIKSSHGDTPFSLTYGTEAVIPTEIRMPTYRTAIVDVVHNNEELRLNLDLLEEQRECAPIHEAKAKLKMTKYYNTNRPGDFVYRSNEASHAMDRGKLGPKWEGPYEVTKALGDGAYRLRSTDGAVIFQTWNVANLKKCYL